MPDTDAHHLYRPLLMPAVTDPSALLNIDARWDYATMNARHGYPQPTSPRPRVIGHQIYSRFCTLEQFDLAGAGLVGPDLPALPALVVTPAEDVICAVGESYPLADHISWSLINHPERNKTLFLAACTALISSRYVAYLDTDVVLDWLRASLQRIDSAQIEPKPAAVS